MVDLQKPCVKCGAVDRYKSGSCGACDRTRKRTKVDLMKPCVKCGVVDRYPSGRCRPCKIKAKKRYLQSDEGRAKANAYMRKYNKSRKGSTKHIARWCIYRKSAEYREKINARKREYDQAEYRAKNNAYMRNYYQSAEGHKRIQAAKLKAKKRNFEFSVQNQQKVIEQCQQKLT